MTEVQQLAAFVHAARYAQISARAVEQIKIRILDTLGVAIGALDAPPMQAIRRLTQSLGGNGASTLIGGGSSAPDRAAFCNIGLSRYLDFMDSYLAPGETCHPSDNIGAVLAAAESVNASGKDFITAVAVAYQVQTRLSDVAPVRAKGFDHTVQGAYAVAAAVAKVLGLDAARTANAIAISGTYMFDGQMNYHHSGNAPVHAPNSEGRSWSDETGAVADGWEMDGEMVRRAYTLHREDDDFGQAGTLVREVWNDAQREQFVDQVAGSLLGGVRSPVLERAFDYWKSVDAGTGNQIERKVRAGGAT